MVIVILYKFDSVKLCNHFRVQFLKIVFWGVGPGENIADYKEEHCSFSPRQNLCMFFCSGGNCRQSIRSKAAGSPPPRSQEPDL